MPHTKYIWDPLSDNVLMEKDESGDTKATNTYLPEQYGDLISQRRDGETRFYHFDGQGSTRALTDQDEDVTDTYTYTAFGEEISRTGTTENPYRYVGERGYYFDEEAGVYYVRARTYEPRIGRWMSVDPICLNCLGPYQYVTNRPIALIDASGLQILYLPPPVGQGDAPPRPLMDPFFDFLGKLRGHCGGFLYRIATNQLGRLISFEKRFDWRTNIHEGTIAYTLDLPLCRNMWSLVHELAHIAQRPLFLAVEAAAAAGKLTLNDYCTLYLELEWRSLNLAVAYCESCAEVWCCDPKDCPSWDFVKPTFEDFIRSKDPTIKTHLDGYAFTYEVLETYHRQYDRKNKGKDYRGGFDQDNYTPSGVRVIDIPSL